MDGKYYGKCDFKNTGGESISIKDQFNKDAQMNIYKIGCISVNRFELHTKNMDKFNDLYKVVIQPFYYVKARFTPREETSFRHKFLTIEGSHIISGNDYEITKNSRIGSGIDIYGEDLNGGRIDLMIEPGDTFKCEIEFITYMHLQ